MDELEELARDSLPSESCAFLLGRSEGAVRVRDILPMRNADDSRISFSILPDELLAAYQEAERRGLDIVGIFHSHPSSPVPSGTDRRFMEINPVVWVIFSTTENSFGAWIFAADSVQKVEIRA
ncbi:MAG: M67 family metallopeptidase [Nitrososphaera sp.]